MCQMEEQADYVYKKVEQGKAISVNVMQHEQSFIGNMKTLIRV